MNSFTLILVLSCSISWVIGYMSGKRSYKKVWYTEKALLTAKLNLYKEAALTWRDEAEELAKRVEED